MSQKVLMMVDCLQMICYYTRSTIELDVGPMFAKKCNANNG